jgi:hypothetical protein
MALLTVAIYVALAVAGILAYVLVLSPRTSCWKMRHTDVWVIHCPKTGKSAVVAISRCGFRRRTTQLTDCSLWPDLQVCGGLCVASRYEHAPLLHARATDVKP